MPLTLSSAQKRSSLPLVLAVVPVFTLHQYIQERDPVAVAATGLLLLVIGIWLAVSARIVEPDRPVEIPETSDRPTPASGVTGPDHLHWLEYPAWPVSLLISLGLLSGQPLPSGWFMPSALLLGAWSVLLFLSSDLFPFGHSRKETSKRQTAAFGAVLFTLAPPLTLSMYYEYGLSLRVIIAGIAITGIALTAVFQIVIHPREPKSVLPLRDEGEPAVPGKRSGRFGEGYAIALGIVFALFVSGTLKTLTELWGVLIGVVWTSAVFGLFAVLRTDPH
jgi:hypothetical protein